MGKVSKQIESDLEAHLQESYNRLIRTIMRRLATKKRSPVWTGFFASSWKAEYSPIQPVDRVEDFSPWAELAEIKANASWDKEPVPTNYIIKPRFYPPERFNYRRRTYIGNSAEYAIYALEKGNVQTFVQGGELAGLIKDAFKERKPSISAAYDAKKGVFGSTAGKTYIAYEEF